MKRIGIIGGLGPESTIDYYKEIINHFKIDNDEMNYPEILIYSVNMANFHHFIKQKEFDNITLYLLEKIESLRLAGAEFAVIGANTPHIIYNELNKKSSLPLISIVEATCRYIKTKEYKRPGLLGTALTMDATFYQDVCIKEDINVIMPEIEDRKIINQKLFSEIELGIFKDETRAILVSIIDKMVKTHQIDSIILGCTEFPLILTDSTYAGVPTINTTKQHVKEIIEYCLS